METSRRAATDDQNPGFSGFLALLLDGGEFTIIPLLLGIACGAAAGWRLAAAYLPGAEYASAAVGAALGVVAGIALATGLVGFLLGWAAGWLALLLLRTAFGIDSEWIVLVPKYAGAAIGGFAGVLCTVVALANTWKRQRHRS